MKLVAQNIHPHSNKEPSLLNDYSVLTDLSLIMNDVEKNNKNGGPPIGSIKEPNAKSKDPNSQKIRLFWFVLY